MNAAAWVFLFAAVVFALLLVCALLGAHEQQEAHYRKRADMAARNLKLREENADLRLYAEALEELADSKRPTLRPIESAPKFASVTDLIAYNEAKRNLDDDRIHRWLEDWSTDGDGA